MEVRELAEGERDENVVLAFRPTPARDMAKRRIQPCV